jgi:hypothetical protein
MPWGAELPRVVDDAGEPIRRGPPRSLLEGVQLQSYTAVATLAVRAWLVLINGSAMSIEGFNGFEAKYPAAARAGHEIVRLINSVRAVTQNRAQIPTYYDLIHQALLEPDLSFQILRENMLRTNEAEDAQEHGRENHSRGTSGRGLGSRTNRESSRQPYDSSSSSNPGTSNSDLASSSRPLGRSGLSLAGDDIPGDLIFTRRRERSGTQYNTPAARGDWEFVEGTDLSDAVLGKPEPAKLFLIRQKHSDPEGKKDVREYPGLHTMDWTNPDHIASLNRARRQIRMRTNGTIAEPRLPWTQMEKDELKRLVQNALNAGQTRNSIDWKAISSNMSKRFEGVIQKAGEPLAQCTNVVDGVEQEPRKKRTDKLKTERTGVNRGPRAVQNQADKYGDIKLILDATVPKKVPGKRKKRESTSKQKSESPEYQEEDAADLTDSDDEPLQLKLKRRKGPKDEPDRGPKDPPGGPPPSGGAGGLAGPMGKSFGVVSTRTAMPAR